MKVIYDKLLSNFALNCNPRQYIKGKLAEAKYKAGTGGKMTATCLATLNEELKKERAKQKQISSELQKEQTASRNHARAAAELSFGERRLANAQVGRCRFTPGLKQSTLRLLSTLETII